MRATDGIWAGHRELLLQACAAYNAQDVEALPARISDDVDWPAGAGSLHAERQCRLLRSALARLPRSGSAC